MIEKLKKIKAFNDHSNCKGHGNWMLDCEFESQEDRDVLIKCLNNYIDETN